MSWITNYFSRNLEARLPLAIIWFVLAWVALAVGLYVLVPLNTEHVDHVPGLWAATIPAAYVLAWAAFVLPISHQIGTLAKPPKKQVRLGERIVELSTDRFMTKSITRGTFDDAMAMGMNLQTATANEKLLRALQISGWGSLLPGILGVFGGIGLGLIDDSSARLWGSILSITGVSMLVLLVLSIIGASAQMVSKQESAEEIYAESITLISG